MRYQRLPYLLRYLIAVVTWAAIVVGDMIARVALAYVIPLAAFLHVREHNQASAQRLADTADILTRRPMRFPRADWRRLFGLSRRGSPADCRPELIQ